MYNGNEIIASILKGEQKENQTIKYLLNDEKQYETVNKNRMR